MTTSAQITREFSRLEKELENFNQWWSRQVLCGESYVLDVCHDDSGNKKSGSVRRVEVDIQQGAAAVESARTMFAKLERDDDKQAGTVCRLPGWFIVDGFDRRPIQRINRKKDALRQHIAEAIPAGIQRDRFCRRLFPGVSMLQVYRRIPMSERPFVPRKISFTWSPVTVSTKLLTVTEALELLDKREEDAGDGLPEQVLDSISIARRLISTLPNHHVIARRKPVAPHPRMTLFAKTAAQNEMLHAHLPLLLSERSKDVDVQQLRSFDRSVRKKARRDKKKIWPILESMNLFSLEMTD